jgi:hypothetical protein
VLTTSVADRNNGFNQLVQYSTLALDISLGQCSCPPRGNSACFHKLLSYLRPIDVARGCDSIRTVVAKSLPRARLYATRLI